jgi:hypothetical protein
MHTHRAALLPGSSADRAGNTRKPAEYRRRRNPSSITSKENSMSRKQMFGFVDPITLGFIIAIAGTAVGIGYDKTSGKTEPSVTASQPAAQTATVASATQAAK